MRVLGMISGTSHDGIDCAVVDFDLDGDVPGGVLRATVVHRSSQPYSASLRSALTAALPPAPTTAAALCELDVRVGQEFAAAASAVPAAFDAVSSHGQTLYHWVEGGWVAGGAASVQVRGTLQVGQPCWIAEATGVPVVADLRSADVAAGGQGAPLVALLDSLLLAPAVAAGHRVAALNLGGIANATVCAPGGAPVAWDTGPANALVDAVVTADASGPDGFDRDGRLAAAGTVQPDLLDAFLAEPYYALPAPKSSGKELFHSGYVEEVVACTGLRPQLADLVATLTTLTARTVADALRAHGVEQVFASGGGVRNPTLMAMLARELGEVELHTTDELGCPSDEKEAIAFALIGLGHPARAACQPAVVHGRRRSARAGAGDARTTPRPPAAAPDPLAHGAGAVL